MTKLNSVLEGEIEKVYAALSAGEPWSDEYKKDLKTHSQLIIQEAKLYKAIRQYFLEFTDRLLMYYIDWTAYASSVTKVQADDLKFDVDVVINEIPSQEDGLMIKVIFQPIAAATAIGAIAGENIYQIPLGINDLTDFIQESARQQVAELVGNKIDKKGRIIPNPKAEYRITDSVRKDIRSAVTTSYNLGEDVQQLKDRLVRVVNNPKRAETIARTESVNAYQKGLHEFGIASGAIGKEWKSLNPLDICGEFASLGVVPIDYLYGGYTLGPVAHPNCRCSRRLIYPGTPSAKKLLNK